MDDNIKTDRDKQKQSKQEKVVSLFKFIEELNKLKQKVILNVSDYPWWRSIDSFPNDSENIKVYYRDQEDADRISDVLLSVHKPEFETCPEPDFGVVSWLELGWNDYRCSVKIKDKISSQFNRIDDSNSKSEELERIIDEEDHADKEHFADNKERVRSYDAWIEERNIWVSRQKMIAKTRNFFAELYKICMDLERESETLELVVANGFIRDREMPEIDHPILTRRVKIYHEAVENTIYIEDLNVETEVYSVMFQGMNDVNLASVNHFCDVLHQNDYHPLDQKDLSVFLRTFIHELSSEGIYSEEGIPDKWEEKERLLLYTKPCYILRKRMDGTLKAIREIIEDVDKNGNIPAPICDIVDGGTIDVIEDAGELSVEEQLAAVGGESVDILLSKEANKEQLEIARRIERYNAVLVQGPPGTGKTHTIANLMGHFLAQGKSVLVTSYTQKALSVLKEKVASGLQSLCVSMLDDSNIDMERSIDGITSRMSQYTSFELKREMESLGQERQQIIRDLASVRKKIFSIINQEHSSIVYNGKAISPSDAAAYVRDNSKDLSYIPGNVQLYEPIPLSFAELTELYKSNGVISVQDETELEHDIPDPAMIMSPVDFEQKCRLLDSETDMLKSIEENTHWHIENSYKEDKISIKGEFGQIYIKHPSEEDVEQLKKYISTFPKIATWIKYCIADGKKDGTYRQRWIRLIEQIKKTCDYAEKFTSDSFGKEIIIHNKEPEFVNDVKRVLEKYNHGWKIGKVTLLFNKQLNAVLNGVTINGQKPQNAEDCKLILQFIEMKSMRDQCSSYWNDLIANYGVPCFYDLDMVEPERAAAKYIPVISRYLDWFKNEYEVLTMRMNAVGLPCDVIFQYDMLDSEITATEKILLAIEHDIPELCRIFDIVKSISDLKNELNRTCDVLKEGRRSHSSECKAIISAVETYDIQGYNAAYSILEITYGKVGLKHRREEYLSRLAHVAPQWTEAIRNRDGIHGNIDVPDNIEDAWKWKQYDSIIEDIVSEPFDELQEKSRMLSRKYREITAEFAEKSAWYHLLRKTERDISMKQALNGWKQTVKRIGKGTGKNAPMYRAEARKLMVKCQNAVPGWIMPIGKALESLNPSVNKFDVIIIDEASQADISSMAILYMGKKLIIVGDDKQVSPMAVGTSISKVNDLKKMYIEGKAPNAHLYDNKTSIYDVAATTFQPLMLQEHFRCVPEIIGFSNWLSYDFKIKPLRDSSNSALLPAVVNYRVMDGERVEKINSNEAKAIVSLLQACIEQPEYEGKTFGIISLLGDDQVKRIQEEIYRHIDTKVCSERRILCGNPSHFQGDERDVIFLSMVDSGNGNGPIKKRDFGSDDAYRKRYNVAASRAKDQLWVVTSLDPANDLKSGDIRKMLIDYSLNPESVYDQNARIEKKAESPFEIAVVRYLTVRGYHLVQQWKVGAYRLDMVAICGERKVAIECDGERYHSDENKIREDMERQTILERLGWHFIRIRGSEYYRNPDGTMERVIQMLNDEGIKPEKNEMIQHSSDRDTELLRRVKQRAYKILHENNETSDFEPDLGTIAAALDPKNDVIGTVITGEKHNTDQGTEVICANETSSQNELIPKTELIDSVVSDYAPIRKNERNRQYESGEEIKPVKQHFTKYEQMTLPGLDDVKSDDEDIIELLRDNGIRYIDKRSKGGRLWIVGGKELVEFVKKAKTMGYIFQFKKEGGRATRNQPGWWMK